MKSRKMRKTAANGTNNPLLEELNKLEPLEKARQIARIIRTCNEARKAGPDLTRGGFVQN